MLDVYSVQENSAGQVPGKQMRSEGADVPGVLSLTTPANITTDAAGPCGATVTHPARPARRRRHGRGRYRYGRH